MKYSDINKCLDEMIQLRKLMVTVFSGNLYSSTLDTVLESCRDLFLNCPFQVGHKVILNETPLINEDNYPGWLMFKSLLVKGQVGEVLDIYYESSEYSYLIRFDEYEREGDFLIKETLLDRYDEEDFHRHMTWS